jgi:hypothetical protein
MAELPPLPMLPPAIKEWLGDRQKALLGEYVRSYAEQALKPLLLPKSYGGSTFSTWGDQKEGCTVRLHFTDAKAAEEWVNRLTDNWDAAIRARSSMESKDV